MVFLGNYNFPKIQRGSNIFLGGGAGSNFFQGGGGRIQMLIFIETYRNWDFPARGSAYLPSGSAHVLSSLAARTHQ